MIQVRFVLFTSVIISIFLLLGINHQVRSVTEFNYQTSVDASPYSCRHGLSSLSSFENQWLDYFKAGWTLNFTTAPSGTTNLNAVNSTFTPMVRMKQNRAGDGTYLNSYYTIPSMSVIRETAQNYPGRVWFLGNEPDRVVVQDDMKPEMYAVAFHEVSSAIRAEDPTALIAIAGLIQPTPGRLQYLDIVWDTYLSLYGQPMQVDIWNMHGYILAEKMPNGEVGPARVALGTDPALAVWGSDLTPKSCNLSSNPNLHTDNIYCYSEHDSQPILKQHIINMRTWMKEHGQQDKPLVINEFGSLFTFLGYDDPINPTVCFLQDENGNCFTQQRVTDHLEASVNLFETFTDPNLGYPQDDYRMVQQWLWFTLFTNETGQSSNLLVDEYENYPAGDPRAVTQIGQAFRDITTSESLNVNLKPHLVPSVAAFRDQFGSVTVDLSSSVLNVGNLDSSTSINVSFYSNSSLTQLIGTASVNDLLRGCGLPNLAVEATVPWNLTTPGVHRFWVKVDSANSISESNESDNVATGTVIVDPENIFLPMLGR